MLPARIRPTLPRETILWTLIASVSMIRKGCDFCCGKIPSTELFCGCQRSKHSRHNISKKLNQLQSLAVCEITFTCESGVKTLPGFSSSSYCMHLRRSRKRCLPNYTEWCCIEGDTRIIEGTHQQQQQRRQYYIGHDKIIRIQCTFVWGAATRVVKIRERNKIN